MRNAAGRYSNLSTYWYFWCIRTGHGDRESARTLAEQYWNSLRDPIDWHEKLKIAVGQIVEGERASAKSSFRDIFKMEGYAPAGLYAAILADEDGEIAVRDELFRELETNSSQVAFAELSNYLRGVLSGGDRGRWDPYVMDLLPAKITGNDTPFLYFLAGDFLGRHGLNELSEEYLQCAATVYDVNLGTVLAANALRKQNIAIGKIRSYYVPDSVIPLWNLMEKSRKAQSAKQWDEAQAFLTELLKTRVDYVPALLERSNLNEKREQYADAIADLEQVIKIDPNFYYAHNRLAQILSTCEKDEFRNGKMALEHAEFANSQRQFETWLSVSVLASAQAECGQFEKAVELEKRARTLAGFLPEFDKKHHTDEVLKCYSAGKPYHGKRKVSIDKCWR